MSMNEYNQIKWTFEEKKTGRGRDSLEDVPFF